MMNRSIKRYGGAAALVCVLMVSFTPAANAGFRSYLWRVVHYLNDLVEVVGDLRSDVSDLSTRVDGLGAGGNGDLQAAVDANAVAVAGLEGDVAILQTDVDELGAEVAASAPLFDDVLGLRIDLEALAAEVAGLPASGGSGNSGALRNLRLSMLGVDGMVVASAGASSMCTLDQVPVPPVVSPNRISGTSNDCFGGVDVVITQGIRGELGARLSYIGGASIDVEFIDIAFQFLLPPDADPVVDVFEAFSMRAMHPGDAAPAGASGTPPPLRPGGMVTRVLRDASGVEVMRRVAVDCVLSPSSTACFVPDIYRAQQVL